MSRARQSKGNGYAKQPGNAHNINPSIQSRVMARQMLGLRVRRPARPVLLPQANRLLPQVNEAVDAKQPGHKHNRIQQFIRVQSRLGRSGYGA